MNFMSSLAILFCGLVGHVQLARTSPVSADNSITGVLNDAVADVRDVILEERNASHHQIPNLLPTQLGIDAPYIFLRPTNQSKPSNFPFGDGLLDSLLQALMPANSTAHPTLAGIAKSPAQLAPDVLLNQLLEALIPVLGAAPHESNIVAGNSTSSRDHKIGTSKFHQRPAHVEDAKQ